MVSYARNIKALANALIINYIHLTACIIMATGHDAAKMAKGAVAVITITGRGSSGYGPQKPQQYILHMASEAAIALKNPKLTQDEH